MVEGDNQDLTRLSRKKNDDLTADNSNSKRRILKKKKTLSLLILHPYNIPRAKEYAGIYYG